MSVPAPSHHSKHSALDGARGAAANYGEEGAGCKYAQHAREQARGEAVGHTMSVASASGLFGFVVPVASGVTAKTQAPPTISIWHV